MNIEKKMQRMAELFDTILQIDPELAQFELKKIEATPRANKANKAAAADCDWKTTTVDGKIVTYLDCS